MRRQWSRLAVIQAVGLVVDLGANLWLRILLPGGGQSLSGLVDWNAVLATTDLGVLPLSAAVWLAAALHALRPTAHPGVPVSSQTRFIVALCQGWLPLAMLWAHQAVTALLMQWTWMGTTADSVPVPLGSSLHAPLQLCAGMIWVLALLAACYPVQRPAAAAVALLFWAQLLVSLLAVGAGSASFVHPTATLNTAALREQNVLYCLGVAFLLVVGLNALARRRMPTAWACFAPLLASFAISLCVAPLIGLNAPVLRPVVPLLVMLGRLHLFVDYFPVSGMLYLNHGTLTASVSAFTAFRLAGNTAPVWLALGLAFNLAWLAALVALASWALREREETGSAAE